jgi:protein phosphatase 2C family protein 2/3
MPMDHKPCSLSEKLRVESLGAYVNDGYLNGSL